MMTKVLQQIINSVVWETENGFWTIYYQTQNGRVKIAQGNQKVVSPVEVINCFRRALGMEEI